MKKRILGKQNSVTVSEVGLGCMGFSHGYGPGPDREEAIQLIRTAYELGCTFFDTAESYGAGRMNGWWEKPSSRSGRRSSLPPNCISRRTGSGNGNPGTSGRIPEAPGDGLCGSLLPARVSKKIPVEEVAGVMGRLIDEGKIRGWGQSQATEEEVRRAHAVTPSRRFRANIP